MKRYVKYICA